MNYKYYINRAGEKSLFALRRYPLQFFAAGFAAFLFLFILMGSEIFPHSVHGQILRNSANPSLLNDQFGERDAHQALTQSASYADLVDKVAPAVVTVRSEKKVAPQAQNMPFDNEMMRQFFGGRVPQSKQSPQIERGLGSGVIIKSDGTILTNNHVVDGASQVKVDLPDKRTFDATVVGTDAASDLAVLKIETNDLPTLALGDSDNVRVGDVVLAIGNPLGLRQTVTSGIISAKGRQTGLSDGSFEDFLQTDAPINQGNSGGALVNLTGELIGINSQIMSPSGGSIGIGFAIPSNMARSVAAQLLSGGKVRRGMLGVGIQDVTSDLAENFGLKEVRGVIVTSVTAGSPAEKSGLRQGDVIVNLNGAAITDGNDLRNRIAQTAPGTEVSIGFLRDGNSEQTAKVALGEFQPKNAATNNDQPIAEPTHGKLGLALEPVTPQILSEPGLKNSTSGLIVADVQAGSPADEAGIGRGDVIQQINRQNIKTIADVNDALTKSKNNTALILLNRGGQTLFVTVKIM